MPASPIPVDVERVTRQTDLSAETAYTLLRSRRTRSALCVLSSCDTRLELDQLAAAIASVDADASVSSARLSLVHVTLPKLEDYGLLEYERRGETVRLDGPLVEMDDPLGPVPSADGDDAIDPDLEGPFGSDVPLGGDPDSTDATDRR